MWAIHRTWKEEESMAWENAGEEEVDELWKNLSAVSRNKFWISGARQEKDKTANMGR